MTRLLAFLARLGWRREADAQPPAPPPAQAAAPAPPKPAAPIAPPLSAADRDILVRTVYGEARGETDAGQVAVVHVVRNRVLARRSSAAAECQRPWQFSCWNPGDPNEKLVRALRPDSPDYLKAAAVVDRAWAAPDTVAGARHYYAKSMPQPPGWAKEGRGVVAVGGHVFVIGVA